MFKLRTPWVLSNDTKIVQILQNVSTYSSFFVLRFLGFLSSFWSLLKPPTTSPATHHFCCTFFCQVVTNKMRKRYTVAQKLSILRQVDQRLSQGDSLQSAASFVQIQPCQLREWRRNKVKMMSAPSNKN